MSDDLPPLEPADDDGPPPLEEVDNGGDLPPLEEVKNEDDDGNDDGPPPLEEVKATKIDDDGVPELEEVTGNQVPPLGDGSLPRDLPPDFERMMANFGQQPSIPGLKSSSKRSRSEKKAKKLLLKQGNLQAVPNVTKVTIKQNKLLFVFENPEVYKTSKKFYVIFGTADIRDVTAVSSNLLGKNVLDETEEIAQELEEVPDGKEENLEETPGKEEEKDEEEEVSDAESDVSLGEIDDKDVSVVMEQANTSRNKAIKALKNSNGDIVDAVMNLQNN